MNASSSTSKIAITGHAASVTVRLISSSACAELSPTITIAASWRMEAVDAAT